MVKVSKKDSKVVLESSPTTKKVWDRDLEVAELIAIA